MPSFRPPPELLALEDVPSFWKGLWGGLAAGLWFIVSCIVALAISMAVFILFSLIVFLEPTKNASLQSWLNDMNSFLSMIIFGGCVVAIFSGGLLSHFSRLRKN